MLFLEECSNIFVVVLSASYHNHNGGDIMKLVIGEEIREISPNQVLIFETQLGELEEALKKNLKSTPAEWLNETGSDNSISGALRASGFRSLSTDIGLAFLKHKFNLNRCHLKEY